MINWETREQIRADLGGRWAAVIETAQWFAYGHLPQGLPQVRSMDMAMLARNSIRQLPDSEELIYFLRDLLQAKDCLVRATIQFTEDQKGNIGS